MPIKPENRKLYPANWRALSHYIRFVRARGHCENCGVQHGQRRLFSASHAPVILTTAHLDHDPTNNKRSNLKALCQECHLAHDRADNAARAKRSRSLRKDTARPLLRLINLLLQRKDSL